MAGFENTLASIPGLGGYLAKSQMNQQQGMNELQQMSGSMGILAKLQAQQQEQQLRGELAALGPNPSQESLAAIASRFSPAKDILTSQTASLDRKATLDAANINRDAQREQMKSLQSERLAQQFELAKQRSQDQALSKAEQNQARMDMIRLTASLRPAPAERNLQLTADAEGNQLIVNPDGTTQQLTAPGGGGVRKAIGTDKPMTEFQGKAALYGTRAAQSDKVLKALEDKISTTGLSAAQSMGTIGNFLMSSEQKRVSQAQRDFVNAVLRQESGAVISDAEFSNAKQQYFPAAGDDNNTIEQKRANRQMAIQGFARMSGPKGSVDIRAVIDNPLLPGVRGNPVTPQESRGNAPKRRASDSAQVMRFDAQGNLIQ